MNRRYRRKCYGFACMQKRKHIKCAGYLHSIKRNETKRKGKRAKRVNNYHIMHMNVLRLDESLALLSEFSVDLIKYVWDMNSPVKMIFKSVANITNFNHIIKETLQSPPATFLTFWLLWLQPNQRIKNHSLVLHCVHSFLTYEPTFSPISMCIFSLLASYFVSRCVCCWGQAGDSDRAFGKYTHSYAHTAFALSVQKKKHVTN